MRIFLLVFIKKNRVFNPFSHCNCLGNIDRLIVVANMTISMNRLRWEKMRILHLFRFLAATHTLYVLGKEPSIFLMLPRKPLK